MSDDSAELIAAPVVEALEARRARLCGAIAASGRFRVLQGGVRESGPYLVRACIRCERARGAGARLVLGLCATVVRWPGSEVTELSADVSWFREPTVEDPVGYVIHEASARPATDEGPASVTDLVAELDRLEAAMLRAIRRGRPPALLVIRWRQLLGRCRPPWIWREPPAGTGGAG